jgi:hypothetical protein
MRQEMIKLMMWSSKRKYNTKTLAGDFNVKLWREDISKSTIVNETLHEIIIDNWVTVANFATSQNITANSTTFPLHNILFLKEWLQLKWQ